jgi:hypothetical protein
MTQRLIPILAIHFIHSAALRENSAFDNISIMPESLASPDGGGMSKDLAWPDIADAALKIECEKSECARLACAGLDHIKQKLEELQGIVQTCKGDRSSHNCVEHSTIAAMEASNKNVLQKDLKDIYACGDGEVPLIIGMEAARLSHAIESAKFAQTLTQVAPELAGLKKHLRPPPSNEEASQRAGEVLQKLTANVEMPERLMSMCASEGAAHQSEKLMWWKYLDISDMNSVAAVLESAEFRIKDDTPCNTDNNSKAEFFSFRIVRLPDLLVDAPSSSVIFQSDRGDLPIDFGGGEISDDAKGDDSGIQMTLQPTDFFTMIPCPESAGHGQPCHVPQTPDPSSPITGYKKAGNGELGVCLPVGDPASHLRQLSCAAQALAVHLEVTSSSLVEVGSNAAWADGLVAMAAVVGAVFQGISYPLIIMIMATDALMNGLIAVIAGSANVAAHITALPVQPFMGQRRQHPNFVKFLANVMLSPVCLIAGIYNLVGVSVLATAQFLQHIGSAFGVPAPRNRPGREQSIKCGFG